jgi:hypothetical protein
MNRYAYVQNNPLRWVDPTGHAPQDPKDGPLPFRILTQAVRVGLDAVHSYFTDPDRTTPEQKHRFLHLLAQVRFDAQHRPTATPLPPPRMPAAPTAVEREALEFASRQYPRWTLQNRPLIDTLKPAIT